MFDPARGCTLKLGNGDGVSIRGFLNAGSWPGFPLEDEEYESRTPSEFVFPKEEEKIMRKKKESGAFNTHKPLLVEESW